MLKISNFKVIMIDLACMDHFLFIARGEKFFLSKLNLSTSLSDI